MVNLRSGFLARCVVLSASVGLLSGASIVWADGHISDADIIVVRPAGETEAKQGVKRFEGISGSTAGAKAISMHKVRIPPGGAAKAHIHQGYETAVFVVKGRVRTFYGRGLKKSIDNVAGDFIYIPAGVPHRPVNLSKSEAAEAVVARTDPNEQESVVPYHVGE